MAEQRRSPRFDCFETDNYSVEISDAQASGRLTNLSRSGLAMNVSRELRQNAVYTFNIRLAQIERTIPCQAQIVWVNRDEENKGCTCGAKIIDMDPAEKVEILDALYEEWKKKIITV